MSDDLEPQLDPYYSNLRNAVRMVANDYSNMLMLDAKGGLGKTYNVKQVLSQEKSHGEWTHQKGFTTPIELYKTLYMCRHEGHVLFLDDMSGITSNSKAIDMLKAATDTEGEENWIQYSTSRDIEHPEIPSAVLPNSFPFRGTIIMSFNDMPDNYHIDALRDRGMFRPLAFTYDERIDIIHEVAKDNSFSPLTVSEQREIATWIESVTNESYEVSIRTLDEICSIRHFGNETPDVNWEKMALDAFNIDYDKHLVIKMREAGNMSIADQITEFKNKTGKSQSTYYNIVTEIKNERGL